MLLCITEPFLLSLQIKVSNHFPFLHTFAFITFVSSLNIVNSFVLYVGRLFLLCPTLCHLKCCNPFKMNVTIKNRCTTVYCATFKGKSGVTMCSHLLLFKIPGCFTYFGPLLSLKASHCSQVSVLQFLIETLRQN